MRYFSLLILSVVMGANMSWAYHGEQPCDRQPGWVDCGAFSFVSSSQVEKSPGICVTQNREEAFCKSINGCGVVVLTYNEPRIMQVGNEYVCPGSHLVVGYDCVIQTQNNCDHYSLVRTIYHAGREDTTEVLGEYYYQNGIGCTVTKVTREEAYASCKAASPE